MTDETVELFFEERDNATESPPVEETTDEERKAWTAEAVARENAEAQKFEEK